MVLAIFDFSSILTVFLLLVCTSAFLREMKPVIFDAGMVQEPGQPLIKRPGLAGFLWKLSRVGERLSPLISVSCIFMAGYIIFK